MMERKEIEHGQQRPGTCTTALFVGTMIWLLIGACQKEQTAGLLPSNPIMEAKSQLENEMNTSVVDTSTLSYHQKLPRTVLWEKAYQRKLHDTLLIFAPVYLPEEIYISLGDATGIPLNGNLWLRANLTDDNWRFHLITVVPDYISNDGFTGLVMQEDWFDGTGGFLRVMDGMGATTQQVNNRLQKKVGLTMALKPDLETCEELSYQTCVTVESPTGDGSTSRHCTRHYVTICEETGEGQYPGDPGENEGGGGSGSSNGSGGASIPSDARMPWQENPSINLDDYLDCFTTISNTGATYKVTVYVLEPSPGSGSHSGINGVGHVAMGLTKTGSNGKSITQVIGFYPVGTNIFKEYSGPSKIVDNGHADYEMEYTIKMDFNMGADATNFQKILHKASKPPANYHAFDNNCVRYVYDACVAGTLDIPFKISFVNVPINPLLPGGPTTTIQAYTPAGMAQEMRARKGQGDNRVSIANHVTVQTSNGPC